MSRITNKELQKMFIEHEAKDIAMFQGITTELKYLKNIGYYMALVLTAYTGQNFVGVIG